MLKFISRSYLATKEYEIIETRLNYKVCNELKKYISVQNVMYNSNVKINDIPEKIILLPLPFKPNSYIKKIIAYIYIHHKLLNKIRREKNNLFIIGVTSKIINILLIPFALYRDRILVQLYTPSVAKSRLKRTLLDTFTRFLLKLFKNYLITGNNRTKQVYKLRDEKCLYVKLGMPVYGNKEQLQMDKIRLLYLGTLNTREIYKVVLGIRKFVDTYNLPIIFNICGFGAPKEVDKLVNSIKQNKLDNIVKFHGFVPYKDFIDYIDMSNIGLSYVPNISKYNGVSITKTVEYMLSGLPVIGTKNSFNRKTINGVNGILCDDNPDSFCEVLKEMWDNFKIYKPNKIKETVKEYSMENCIKEGYLPVLKSVAQKQKCELQIYD